MIASAVIMLLAWIAWESLMLLARRQRCIDEVAAGAFRESAIDAVERRRR